MNTGDGQLSIRLVVGLGNPGAEYEATRHNVGYMVLDRLLVKTPDKRFKSHRFGLVVPYCPGIYLLKPLTFMNLSGEAVAPMMRYLRLEPKNLLIVSDDLDLELGRVRVRQKGSAGGHNGLKSIAQSLGSEAFARIRVGIGRPVDPRHRVIDWVLGRFTADEGAILDEGLAVAEGAIDTALREGGAQAMNRGNQASKA